MEKLRLYCFTSNEVTPTTRLYEVDSPRTGLIMMDAICEVWTKYEKEEITDIEQIVLKREMDLKTAQMVLDAVKNEIDLLPERGSFFFPLINLEVFKNGEWEIWEDQEGDDIKQYEVENFDLLVGIR